jgi:hypothetical protein
VLPYRRWSRRRRRRENEKKEFLTSEREVFF